ncbi:MAG: hypothetical protein ACTSX1_15775 [Candidatus Heimdallarchaeaceae archaeon]
MPSPESNYRSVSMNKEQIENIKTIIDNYPELRYKSVAHFVEVSVLINPDYKRLITDQKTETVDLIPKPSK